MHNIKFIRKDPEFFTEKIIERNIQIDLKVFLNLTHQKFTIISK